MTFKEFMDTFKAMAAASFGIQILTFTVWIWAPFLLTYWEIKVFYRLIRKAFNRWKVSNLEITVWIVAMILLLILL